MKMFLTTLAIVGAFATSPMLLAEPNEQHPSMEQRIREADISVALKQYEKVATQLSDTELERELLLQRNTNLSPQYISLTNKMEILEKFLNRLRNQLQEQSKLAEASA